MNPFYRDGRAQIWTLGTETTFSRNWLLDLTYTGTKGDNLDILRAPNRAPPGTNPLDTQAELKIPEAVSFLYDQSGAHSIYNALQVRVIHRFTHGFSFQGIYTFSKSLDNSSSIGGTRPQRLFSKTATSLPNTGSRPSISAISCDFSRCTNCPSASVIVMRRMAGRNICSETGASTM